MPGGVSPPSDCWSSEARSSGAACIQGPSSVPLLREISKESPNPLKRLHGLWTLVGLGDLTAESLSRMAVDPHPGLREHALRVLNDPDIGWMFRLVPMETSDRSGRGSRDPGPAPGRAGAGRSLWSASRLHLTALGRIAARDASDPWMRLAILSGLGESSLAFIPLCLPIKPSDGSNATADPGRCDRRGSPTHARTGRLAGDDRGPGRTRRIRIGRSTR